MAHVALWLETPSHPVETGSVNCAILREEANVPFAELL